MDLAERAAMNTLRWRESLTMCGMRKNALDLTLANSFCSRFAAKLMLACYLAHAHMCTG